MTDTSGLALPAGVEIAAPIRPGFGQILTPEALEFVALLHRRFQPRRRELLAARVERAKRLDAGERPDFLPETRSIREGDWTIAPIPPALHCRRVEITGPVEALASVADDIVSRRDPTLRAPDTPVEEFSVVVQYCKWKPLSTITWWPIMTSPDKTQPRSRQTLSPSNTGPEISTPGMITSFMPVSTPASTL